MRLGRLIIILLVIDCFLMAACNDNDSGKKMAGVARDTSSLIKPPDVDTTSFDSCFEDFFKGLPRFSDSLSAYLVWQNGKRKTLTQFFKDEFMSPVSQYGKKDIDGDGITELVIFNYTGGAHCCDEYFIFSQKNENEFEYKAHIMGGQACIDPATNTITYSFSESLGYFFSCYACGISDSTGKFKTMREIQLKFADSKLQVVNYDTAAARQNITNLEILQQHGFEKIVGLMDNGWRKEFAINFAIWYYNHGKEWKQTKRLFDKYYTFKDADKVWKEFYRTMKEIAKENSF